MLSEPRGLRTWFGVNEDAGLTILQRLSNEYYLGKIELDIDSREEADWFDIYGVVKL